MATTRLCMTLALLIMTQVGPGGALDAQQPTRKRMDESKVIGVIGPTDDSDGAMDWGAPPPGTPHPARERDFDLQHQIVRVSFDWRHHAVAGSTTLRVAALAHSLAHIDLDAVGISIGAVKGADGAPLHYEYDGRVLSVALPSALTPGNVATFTIDYKSVRPKAGVYFVERRHVVWTQGKFEDNRYWVPTYDFPNDKTTWEFYVRTAPGERAWSVGTLAGQRQIADGVEWHWIQETPAPTYFMTVAVGPYEWAEDSAGAIPVRYWAYPDSLDAARTGFAATPRVIDVLSRKLGVPFPARSFDQAVVPDFIFWDALEMWRPLIPATVQDEQLILQRAVGWPGEEGEMAIARAVAEQWFGKLVTPSDWSQLWLSEGVANFLAQVYYGETHGAEAVRRIRDWSHVSAAAADRDARRPLVYDRWQYGPMELMLTEHVGQKGAVVLDMLQHELGDAAFWAGMHRFIEQHAGGTVTTTELQRAMEDASGRDLATFFHEWVYGAGFPFLRVSYRYDAPARRVDLTVTQFQRRDEQTDFFDASADIEILTDSGSIRARMPLHGETSELAVAVPAAPRSIRWDPEHRLLSEVRFERPTEMLIYELEHNPDPNARADAAGELGRRGSGIAGAQSTMFTVGSTAPPGVDSTIMAIVLRAARSDSSVTVRVAAIEGLRVWSLFSPETSNALIDFTHDAAPSIRAAAILGLFGSPSPSVVARLEEMAAGDPDTEVRALALRQLSMITPDSAAALAKRSAVAPMESDEEKLLMLSVAGSNRVRGGWALARQYLTDPTSGREVKEAAMRSLGVAVFMSRFSPEANAQELVQLLTPFLSADDPSLCLAAAREIGQAKIPEATAVLQARKRVEVDARVLTEIDEALHEIARRDPMDDYR